MSVGIGVVLHVFTIVSDIFWMCGLIVSMLTAIGFQLIGLVKKDQLYYLIELHFLQRIWF